jgi:hypothetical protein
MERSEARLRAEGGLSTEQVRSRLGLSRRAARVTRQPVAVGRVRKKAVAGRSRDR